MEVRTKITDFLFELQYDVDVRLADLLTAKESSKWKFLHSKKYDLAVEELTGFHHNVQEGLTNLFLSKLVPDANLIRFLRAIFNEPDSGA